MQAIQWYFVVIDKYEYHAVIELDKDIEQLFLC